jgi:cupin 2 domain-containing protein
MTSIMNVFEAIPGNDAGEQLVELLSRPHLRIERIVSNGHASPEGFWYDQEHAEWVVVLSGEARVVFENEASPRLLRRGDFLDIAAHRRHRVEWTHPHEPTVWLAVHYAST